jgi:NAD(P)-dependent dehydrogenase (short-subunit alcohol dehydrogenase family)
VSVRPDGSVPVVMVTGAAGQLGRGIAGALAHRGSRLLLVDRSEGGLAGLREELGSGPDVAVVAHDVTGPHAPRVAFDEAVTRFGRVDVLVNNAGIEGPIARVEDVDPDDVRQLFEINVFAMLTFTQEAVRRFRTQGHGRIVNMASGAGTAGTGLMAAYSASKHAAVGLSRSVALEVAPAGIQVNAVCPGCVESPMMERIERRIGEVEGGGPASFVSAIPSGRYCDPHEVGQLVAWLALDAPAYITGTTQIIDGGMRA